MILLTLVLPYKYHYLKCTLNNNNNEVIQQYRNEIYVVDHLWVMTYSEAQHGRTNNTDINSLQILSRQKDMNSSAKSLDCSNWFWSRKYVEEF